MTAFKTGDSVRAGATAQGMWVGRTYEVVEVYEKSTAFGNFVTYEIKDPVDGSVFGVRNLHVLASLVKGA